MDKVQKHNSFNTFVYYLIMVVWHEVSH